SSDLVLIGSRDGYGPAVWREGGCFPNFERRSEHLRVRAIGGHDLQAAMSLFQGRNRDPLPIVRDRGCRQDSAIASLPQFDRRVALKLPQAIGQLPRGKIQEVIRTDRKS